MTGFHEWFGRGHQLPLTTTFRCTQTICDVASTSVSKKPNQFQKPMRSAHGAGAPVRIIRSVDSGRARNILHPASGFIGLALARRRGTREATRFLLVCGLVGIVPAVYGAAIEHDASSATFVPLNEADSYLHLAGWPPS